MWWERIYEDEMGCYGCHGDGVLIGGVWCCDW